MQEIRAIRARLLLLEARLQVFRGTKTRPVAPTLYFRDAYAEPHSGKIGVVQNISTLSRQEESQRMADFICTGATSVCPSGSEGTDVRPSASEVDGLCPTSN